MVNEYNCKCSNYRDVSMCVSANNFTLIMATAIIEYTHTQTPAVRKTDGWCISFHSFAAL